MLIELNKIKMLIKHKLLSLESCSEINEKSDEIDIRTGKYFALLELLKELNSL